MQPVGRFQIREVVASGAHGTVCLAWDDHRDELVALKVLKGVISENPELNRRHRDEARMLRRLRHDDIVQVHEMLFIDGRLVVVMEALVGVSLDKLLRRRQAGFPPAVALEITRRVAAALHHAWWTPGRDDGEPMHTVHRDLKPDNIILTQAGEVKVVDFGMAKGQFEDRETVTVARVMGSRAYMAPERLDGEDDTPKVDVYALGLSLFELLTGKPLVLTLHPDKQAAVLARNLGYLQPRGLPPAVVEGLRSLVRAMCAYEPEHRPDMGQVAEAVTSLIEEARLPTHLRAFAEEFVEPELRERTRSPPRQHPAWPEVAFIETVDQAETTTDLPAVPPCHRPTPSQLRVLVRARSPRWMIWVDAPGREEILDALQALCACTEPAFAQMARALIRHSDPAVASKAREVLAHFEGRP